MSAELTRLKLAEQGQIEVPKDKLPDLVRAVYRNSIPVGMGMLHFQEGEIPEETLRGILENPRGIRMDYVHGRQCKFSVYEPAPGRFFISKNWPDHPQSLLKAMLDNLGIPHPL